MSTIKLKARTRQFTAGLWWVFCIRGIVRQVHLVRQVVVVLVFFSQHKPRHVVAVVVFLVVIQLVLVLLFSLFFHILLFLFHVLA